MFVHDSNVKGAVAEQAIVLAAFRLGVPVFRPLSEHGRADLVLEVGSRLLRVQCKWGRLSGDGSVVEVHTGSCRSSALGYLRTTYTEGEVDLFGVYCDPLDRCFLLPVSMVAGKHQVNLRLTPPGNNQRACINLADSFDFEGAVAQLEERCDGIAEARGSSPLSSTSPSGDPIAIGANPFRNHFGYWMERVADGEKLLITRRGKPFIRLEPA
jgi:prevent-host-death family protein